MYFFLIWGHWLQNFTLLLLYFWVIGSRLFTFLLYFWVILYVFTFGPSVASHFLTKPQNRNKTEVDSNWIQDSLRKFGLKLSDCLWTCALFAAFPIAPKRIENTAHTSGFPRKVGPWGEVQYISADNRRRVGHTKSFLPLCL